MGFGPPARLVKNANCCKMAACSFSNSLSVSRFFFCSSVSFLCFKLNTFGVVGRTADWVSVVVVVVCFFVAVVALVVVVVVVGSVVVVVLVVVGVRLRLDCTVGGTVFESNVLPLPLEFITDGTLATVVCRWGRMVETNFTVVVGGNVVYLTLASVVVGGTVVGASVVVLLVVVAGDIVVVGGYVGYLLLGCNVDMIELMRAGKNVVDRTVVVGSLSGGDGFNVVSNSASIGVVVGIKVLVVGGSVVVFLVACCDC